MLCPGCGVSYCLDCEKSVDPRVFRCDSCLQDHVATDPFALSAREAEQREAQLKEKAKAVYDMLVALQPVVHGSADDEIRDAAYHGVIDIRNFVKEQMLGK